MIVDITWPSSPGLLQHKAHCDRKRIHVRNGFTIKTLDKLCVHLHGLEVGLEGVSTWLYKPIRVWNISWHRSSFSIKIVTLCTQTCTTARLFYEICYRATRTCYLCMIHVTMDFSNSATVESGTSWCFKSCEDRRAEQNDEYAWDLSRCRIFYAILFGQHLRAYQPAYDTEVFMHQSNAWRICHGASKDDGAENVQRWKHHRRGWRR